MCVRNLRQKFPKSDFKHHKTPYSFLIIWKAFKRTLQCDWSRQCDSSRRAPRRCRVQRKRRKPWLKLLRLINSCQIVDLRPKQILSPWFFIAQENRGFRYCFFLLWKNSIFFLVSRVSMFSVPHATLHTSRISTVSATFLSAKHSWVERWRSGGLSGVNHIALATYHPDLTTFCFTFFLWAQTV